MAFKIQTRGQLSDTWTAAVLRCRDFGPTTAETGTLEVVRFEDSDSLLTLTEGHPYRILVSDQWTVSKIQSARRALTPQKFGWLQSSADECERLLQESASEVIALASRTVALRNFKEQNRRLSDLSDNLEARVQERTLTLENSKNEVEQRQKRWRALIRLVMELSQVETLQELMVLIKREVKKLHSFGDPMLLVRDQSDSRTIHFFRGAHLFSRETFGLLRGRLEDLPLASLQAACADALERPVARILAVPIGGRGDSAEHWLILESTRAVDDLSQVQMLSVEMLNAMGTVLDRVVARNRIRFETKYWEKTFDAIHDPVAIVDSEDVALRYNQAFLASGTRQDQRLCHQIFAGSDVVCSGCPKRAARETGRSASSEVRSHGRIFEVSSYPIQLADQLSKTHFVNHYSDVTEHRQLLGRLVQNEKMTAIGLMAGSLAHELNNPLTGLSMMSQLLVSDPQVPEKAKEDLREIERAAVRCQNTVRNLLKFTNLELTEEDVVETTWRNIVDQTLPLLKMAMRTLNYHDEVSSDVGRIRVNSHLMGQVVFNLINNACQAMGDEGTLTVRTFVEGDWSLLEISDTGVGMTEEHLEQIFEPFFTTKAKGTGTGLGLSLVQSIVQRFGGHIRVSSRVGIGSQFQVALPRMSP